MICKIIIKQKINNKKYNKKRYDVLQHLNKGFIPGESTLIKYNTKYDKQLKIYTLIGLRNCYYSIIKMKNSNIETLITPIEKIKKNQIIYLNILIILMN